MARKPVQNEALSSAKLSENELRTGIARLSKRIAVLEAFDPTAVREQFGDPGLEALKVSIADALDRTFGSNTVERRRYRLATEFYTGGINMNYETPLREVHDAVRQSRDRNLALLKEAVASLEEQLEELGDLAEPLTAPDLPAAKAESRKIFVVHGHDEGARETVARFIEKIGFEAIILHEQANRGRTVIEKVEAHGDVGFAVVLLTPDDVGGLPTGPQNARARQNVVLELGYFLGRLGRERVCALKKDDIEIPSDFVGVVYEAFDERGGWKAALARELQEAGFEVDWNMVMR